MKRGSRKLAVWMSASLLAIVISWGHYPVYPVWFMSYIEAGSQNIRFWSFQKGNFNGGHTTKYYFDHYEEAGGAGSDARLACAQQF